MYVPIKHLREISSCCLRGKPLGRELSAWLGQSLKSYLEQQSSSLEHAFGLSFPRGGVPWWLEEAMRERDQCLRELAGRYFDGQSTYATAKEIHALARRYGTTSWCRDRACADMPARYAGTKYAYLWRAFRSGAPMPLGMRQLQNVLA